MGEGLSDEDIARIVLEVDLDTIPNAVLRRLIEEVRNEDIETIQGYNRTHNRHNRSSENPAWRYNRSHNRHNRGI
jgi:hypothetical protein